MKLNVLIEGTSPLICNKFSDAAAESATNGTRGSSAAADRGTPREICETKLYIDLDGNPCIPQPNLMRCLVDGGKFHKAGKSQITTSKTTLLYSCVEIEGVTIPIIHKEPWMVDTRAVRIPSTGGRILAHRPTFNDWRLAFTCDLDTAILGMKLFRQIVDDAGKRIGLGDFRPATKGPFGRFVVTKWEVVEEELRDAA